MYTVVRKLRKLFPLKKNKYQVKQVNLEENETMEVTKNNEHSNNDESDDDDFDAKQALRFNKQRRKKQIILPTINLDEYV